MNKKLRYGFALSALVLLAPAVPHVARADQLIDGTFNFTTTVQSQAAGQPPAPTGSFVWDSTTNTWTSWTVNWDGGVFDFGAAYNGSSMTLTALNTIAASNGVWCGVAEQSPPGYDCGTFAFSLDYPGSSLVTNKYGLSNLYAAAAGTYTIQESTVSEPGSLALLAAGLLGLGWAMWRRRLRAPRA